MKRTPLFGLGCAGGAAGISRVADYLEGHRQEAAVLLSIELCTLTIQHDDVSIANLIASGLFGDGAASVLLVGDDHPLSRSAEGNGSHRLQVVDSPSVFFPSTEHIMGWDVRDSGFKVLSSPDVLEVTETHLQRGTETCRINRTDACFEGKNGLR